MKESRLAALDGIRAVAIILVVIGHGAVTVQGMHETRMLQTFVAAISHLGVDVFFVLSGFLISTLLLSEKLSTGRIDLRKFYWRRVRRIFPAYYAYLFIIGGLGVAGLIFVPLTEWLSNVAYLTDYPIGHRVWWTGHAWSLAVEEQFYLIWPALLVLGGINFARQFAITAIVCLPFLRLLIYFALPLQREQISTMFHTRLDVIMVGCLFAIFWKEKKLVDKLAQGFLGNALSLLAGSALILGLIFETKFGGAYKFTFGYSVTATSVALLLNFVLQRPSSLLARFLSLSWIAWIGRISYSLYLWQQPFLAPPSLSPLTKFPLNILAAFSVACASYYLIERRFYRGQPADLKPAAASPGESNPAITGTVTMLEPNA